METFLPSVHLPVVFYGDGKVKNTQLNKILNLYDSRFACKSYSASARSLMGFSVNAKFTMLYSSERLTWRLYGCISGMP